MAWNIFIICFYLNVGSLDNVSQLNRFKCWIKFTFCLNDLYLQQTSDILNLGTGSVSWFEINGYGCKPTYSTNLTAEDAFTVVRPEKVDGCLLDYKIVEIIHASVQVILLVRDGGKHFSSQYVLKVGFVFQVFGLSAATLIMAGFFCDKDYSEYFRL